VVFSCEWLGQESLCFCYLPVRLSFIAHTSHQFCVRVEVLRIGK
jgi:hypothetical protein